MSKSNQYFGEIEENALIDFIHSDNLVQRNDIYNNFLQIPFKKMIECILKIYPVCAGNYTQKELELDALIHLIDKISKFNPDIILKNGKKTKAFSYCNAIIKNYFLDYSVKNYKYKKINVNYQNFVDVCDEKLHKIDEDNEDSDIDGHIMDMVTNKIIHKIKIKLENEKSSLSVIDKVVGNTIINILEHWPMIFLGDDVRNINKSFQKNIILKQLQSFTNLSMKDIRHSIKKEFSEIYFSEKRKACEY